MSLMRSRTRSQVPPPLPSENQRQFFPPSHYAAAAASPRGSPAAFHSPAAPYTPSRELELDNFDSPTPALRQALNRRASMASVRTIDKRRSQADALESLLLPSLNDTIGRMTQPSSPVPVPTFTHDPSRARPPMPQPLSRSRLDNVPHPADQHPAPSHNSPATKATLYSDDGGYQNVSAQSRSASSPAPSVKSVRRVKSVHQSAIPTRIGSGSESESTRAARTPAKPKSSATPGSSAERASRQRSTTTSNSPVVPRAAAASGAPMPPPARRKSTLASAPAPAGGRGGGRAFAARRGAGEDDSSASEVEYEADRLRRQRSRLFVANALVLPSSSESERDARGAASAAVAQGSRLPTLAARRPTVSGAAERRPRAVGLGIEVAAEEPVRRRARTDAPALPAAHPTADTSSDVELAYRDDYPENAANAGTSPSAQLSHDSGETAIASSTKTFPPEPVDRHRLNRRTALLGLVDALGDSPRTASPRAAESLPGPEEDAYSQDAVVAPPIPPADAERPRNDVRSGRRRANTLVMMASQAASSPRPDTSLDRDAVDDQTTPRPPPVTPTMRTWIEPSDALGTSFVADAEHPAEPDSVPAKSPGRTAIKRESVVMNMPARLRRYSVYGSTPEPPELANSPPQETLPSPRDEPLRKPADGPFAGSCAESAFPKPAMVPSDSGKISHADSDLSSVYSSQSARWGGGGDEEAFSFAAEALFKRFNTPAAPETGTDENQPPPNDEQPLSNDEQVAPLSPPMAASGSAVSAASSASSLYDDQNSEDPPPAQASPEPPSAPGGEAPVTPSNPTTKRAAVVRELLALEQDYASRLQDVVRCFIAPLRAQGSTAWLPGVPSDVGRLLSWLEDIARLHAHVSGALKGLHDSAAGECVAHVLREFVPRLEVYQPYLVRADAIVGTLSALVSDEQSDLGEFIRIEEEHAGFRLIPSLLLPLQHLERSLDMFRRLLAATSKTHPDFISSFSLVHSADMVIGVMREVQAREVEYEMVKSIAARIEGLPLSIQLAKRERRLLIAGELARASNTESSSPTVQAFVFTDLLLLAIPLPHDGQEQRWNLCQDLGVSRLLEVDDDPEDSDAFRCHVSAISANDLESGSISPAAAVAALDLRLPANIADTARCAWRRALARCARHTLRSLSFPSHSGRYLAHGPGVDLEADTKRSVVAILAAGLPLPKSPSIHIEEAAHGPAPDDARLEREERGWWSLRFQQVMREMQRQDGE